MIVNGKRKSAMPSRRVLRADAPKMKTRRVWTSPGREGTGSRSLLLGRDDEVRHESAALVGAAPGFVQALTLKRVCQRECGHRVVHFSQRPVPYFLVAADMIVFVDGASLYPRQIACRQRRFHAVQVAIGEA